MTENSRGRRSHRRANRLELFLRHYWFEIVWVAVVALGLFLIFERMSIRRNLLQWVNQLGRGVLQGVDRFGETALAWLTRITLSDAVGFVMVAAAVVAIVWRIRWRMLHNPVLGAEICPKCQGTLQRVHRTWFDHMMDVFVPVRRFRCANSACAWRGLRVHPRHSSTRYRTSARAKSA